MTAQRRYHSGQVTLPVSPNPVRNQNKISILLRKAIFGTIAAMQRMHRLKTEKHIYPDRSISTITETTRLSWSPKPPWPERIGRHPMRDTCVRLKTAGLVRRAPSAQQRSSPLINLWLSDAVSQLDGVRTPQEPTHPASDPYYNWSRILPGFHTYLSSPAWGSSRLHSETKFFFFFQTQTEEDFMSAASSEASDCGPCEVFPWEAPDCSMQIGAGHSVKGPRLQVG